MLSFRFTPHSELSTQHFSLVTLHLLHTLTPMSLKNVDFDSAFRRIADRRIEEAMKEGKFDNLEGAGKDLVLDPAPAEENARLLWWALRIMKQNDVTLDEVRWRKAIDHLKESIEKLTDESTLLDLVVKVNDLVSRLNTLGTNAINLPAATLDLESELQTLRARLGRP